MALGSTQPTAIANKLVDIVILDDEQPTYDKGDKKPQFTSISYFPDGKQIVGGSTYNSARRWDLQTGEEIKDAQVVCEREVWAVAVSSDSRWVIVGGGDRDRNDVGELKACEVETGMMKTFKGHSKIVSCIDVSVDNRLLASGSFDHMARIWDLSLNTGKLVAGPFECAGIVGAVRFSQDSKKLAIKSSVHGRCLEWGNTVAVSTLLVDSPVFCTTNDRSIVAAFRFEDDSEDPTKIYEFDSSLIRETVGAPFEHAQTITGLALSFDCALLASASFYYNTIKLWAFKSRQLLASFDIHNPCTLILSPNSLQLAYTSFSTRDPHMRHSIQHHC